MNDYKTDGKFDIWVLDTRVYRDGEVEHWGKEGAVATGTGGPMVVIAPKFGNFYQAFLKAAAPTKTIGGMSLILS